MGKVVKIKTKNDNLKEFLDDFLKKVDEMDLDNVLIATKVKNGENYVMTGYCNLDLCEKQELLGHIQIDIVNDMIRQNYVTPD